MLPQQDVFLGLVVQAVIVALGEWSQEDQKFKASLGYMSHTTGSRLSVFARPCGRSYYRNENTRPVLQEIQSQAEGERHIYPVVREVTADHPRGWGQ